MTLRLLDLFSGIGGFSYAAERIVGGFETTQFVEREPYCQRVLSRHWPHVPIHDDICTYKPAAGSADVICGGFPCQDISTAGKGAGIAKGTRSGLFYELMRVIRLVGPQFVVLENVAAITSNGMDTVLTELATAGFDAEWACIRASDVGACHRRDRWWLVANAQNMLSDGSTSQQSWQSGSQSVPEPRDGNRADAADTDNTRLQGRQPASVCQHPIEQLAWPGDPPSGGLQPDWRSYVSEPVLRRGDDGLRNRVDRLKALGNSVVPQVAAIPLARVRELAAANGCGIP